MSNYSVSKNKGKVYIYNLHRVAHTWAIEWKPGPANALSPMLFQSCSRVGHCNEGNCPDGKSDCFRIMFAISKKISSCLFGSDTNNRNDEITSVSSFPNSEKWEGRHICRFQCKGWVKFIALLDMVSWLLKIPPLKYFIQMQICESRANNRRARVINCSIRNFRPPICCY